MCTAVTCTCTCVVVQVSDAIASYWIAACATNLHAAGPGFDAAAQQAVSDAVDVSLHPSRALLTHGSAPRPHHHSIILCALSSPLWTVRALCRVCDGTYVHAGELWHHRPRRPGGASVQCNPRITSSLLHSPLHVWCTFLTVWRVCASLRVAQVQADLLPLRGVPRAQAKPGARRRRQHTQV